MFKKLACLCCLLLGILWFSACSSSTDLGKPCSLSENAAKSLEELSGTANIVEPTFQCDIGYCLGTDYNKQDADAKKDLGYCSIICQSDADCPRGDYQYQCKKFLDIDSEKLPKAFRDTIRPLIGRSLCVRIPKPAS